MVFVPSPEPRGVIYALRNQVNGKVYVGQTISLKRRMLEHGVHMVARTNPLIMADVKNFGWEAFKAEVLEENVPKSRLLEVESDYIEKLRTFVDFEDCNGYNLQFRSKQSRGFRNHRSQLMRKQKDTVIVCINTGDVFETIADAAQFCGVKKGTVKGILSGLSYQTRSGYRFEYRDGGSS